MADEDKVRWNNKYAQGAYSQRLHPSPYLEQQLSSNSLKGGVRKGGGQALDVACGAGRNSIFLAQLGYSVIGVDISDVALDRGETRARDLDLDIRWEQIDLENDPVLPDSQFDLIIMFRFVALELIEALVRKLNPTGILIIEEHLQWSDSSVELSGPRSDRFRVEAGKLERLAEQFNLEKVDVFEGLVEEPDGSLAAVARLTAKKRKQ